VCFPTCDATAQHVDDHAWYSPSPLWSTRKMLVDMMAAVTGPLST
jgi:hypothetical protein